MIVPNTCFGRLVGLWLDHWIVVSGFAVNHMPRDFPKISKWVAFYFPTLIGFLGRFSSNNLISEKRREREETEEEDGSIIRRRMLSSSVVQEKEWGEAEEEFFSFLSRTLFSLHSFITTLQVPKSNTPCDSMDDWLLNVAGCCCWLAGGAVAEGKSLWMGGTQTFSGRDSNTVPVQIKVAFPSTPPLFVRYCHCTIPPVSSTTRLQYIRSFVYIGAQIEQPPT